MKILFLIPPPLDGALPAERIFGCNYGIYSQPNIFILYPATQIKNAGYDVTFIDFPVDGKNRADFEIFCAKQKFDLIFFYTVFLSKYTDLAARDMLHKINPRSRYIFMATEPSASPDDFIDDNSIAIRGEPESRVLPIVEAIERGTPLNDIPGISYGLKGEKIHQGGTNVIADLNQLPFPDRSILNVAKYLNPKLSRQPFTTMLSSRGCSFGCYYCVPNSLSFAREIEYKRGNTTGKPPVRLRSAANIIAEFAELASNGYKSISFVDDQFIWGSDRTIEICKGIEPFGIEWSCLARADMLQDKQVITAMGKAGCRYVDIGIESFNQEILDYIGKGCKVEMVYSAVENLKMVGIEPELNVLLASCPLETVETIEKTFQEVLRLDVDYVLFSVCTPFPYTKFNARAKAEGWMIKPVYEAIDPIKESFISYPHLTKKQLDKIIRRLYLRYYFRPTYIWKRLRKLEGSSDFFNKARAALSILR
jgi:anaerobic magnesium-protoporphyrin IX monomethyl ester cyclase